MNFLEVFREGKEPGFRGVLGCVLVSAEGNLKFVDGGFSSTRRVIFYEGLEFFARFLNFEEPEWKTW